MLFLLKSKLILENQMLKIINRRVVRMKKIKLMLMPLTFIVVRNRKENRLVLIKIIMVMGEDRV